MRIDEEIMIFQDQDCCVFWENCIPKTVHFGGGGGRKKGEKKKKN